MESISSAGVVELRIYVSVSAMMTGLWSHLDIEASFTVSSVVYMAAGIDHRYNHLFSVAFAKSCSSIR